VKRNNAVYSLDESLGYWLYRSHIKVAAAFRQALQDSGYDLTPEQWSVLYRLREQEGLNQIQLSEITFKDRHNITRILNQLIRRGYVVKRSDRKDKRAHRIYLTDDGRAVLENIIPFVSRHRHRVGRGFTEHDLQKIRTYLDQIVRNLNHRSGSKNKLTESENKNTHQD